MTATGREDDTKRPSRRGHLTLRGHLGELRKRLTIAAAAIVIGMIGAFIFTDPVIMLLTEPIRHIDASANVDVAALNFDSVTSAFDLRLRMSFVIGLLIAAPIWMAQIWLFLVPALHKRERRYAIGFLASAIPLFFVGCAVGLVITPHAIEMMSTFVPSGGAMFFQASLYYDFVLKLVLVVGVAFVLPVLLVLLDLVGVVTARDILKGWRIAVVIAAAFAGVATPAADVISMFLLAAILVVLYFAAVGVAFLFDRRRAKILAAVESTV